MILSINGLKILSEVVIMERLEIDRAFAK